MELKFKSGRTIEAEVLFNGNLVTVFDSEPDESGFETYNCGVRITDATEYKTLYSKEEGSYILSNDGSVKPEPIPPVPPEPPTPTRTKVKLMSSDNIVVDVIDLDYSQDITFYISSSFGIDYYSLFKNMKAIVIEDSGTMFDIEEDYKFEVCEPVTKYEEPCYYVKYYKLTEQDKLNNQILQNAANIDYIAMETDIDLD